MIMTTSSLEDNAEWRLSDSITLCQYFMQHFWRKSPGESQ